MAGFPPDKGRQWAVQVPVTGWTAPNQQGAQNTTQPSRPLRDPGVGSPVPRAVSPVSPRSAPFETLGAASLGGGSSRASPAQAAAQALFQAEHTAASVAAALHEQNDFAASEAAGLGGGQDLRFVQGQASPPSAGADLQGSVSNRIASAEARAAALRNAAVSADRSLKAAAAGGIRPVVAAMTAHASNADVAEAGCVALRNLSSKMEARDHQLACEGIQAAVGAIHTHSTRPGVLETACDAIRGLSSVLEPGEAGPEPMGALVATLLSMPGSPGPVSHACRAIAAVATRDEEAKQAACTAGAVEAVSNSLHTHSEDAAVVEAVATALVALLTYDPVAAVPDESGAHGKGPGGMPQWAARAAAAAAAAGAPAACFRALSVHAASPAVLERACAALRLLAAPHGNRAACAGAGSVAAVVAALRAHPGHAGLQASACGALRVLAWDAGTKAAAVDAGAVEAVVTAMRAHPQHAGVAEAACGALKSLAAHSSARVRGAKAADVAVEVLRTHGSTPGVCSEACGAIANLCVGQPQNGARATQAGAAAAVVAALTRHAELGDVAEAGAAALWALAGCGDPSSRISCVEHGALPALVGAMRTHQASLPLQVVACSAITHFAQGLSTGATEVAAAGGVDALLSALRLHGNSAALQESGFDALFTLCDRGGLDVARRALQAGALEACKAAITTRFPNHPGVQRAAKAVLEELTRARVNAAMGSDAVSSMDPSLAAVNAQVAGLGVGAARNSCHDAFGASEYLAAMQAKLVGWLGAGGGNSDWLDLVELALTTQWHEWEAGLSTTNVASPDVEVSNLPRAQRQGAGWTRHEQRRTRLHLSLSSLRAPRPSSQRRPMLGRRLCSRQGASAWRVATLAAGDATALLLFSAVGRLSHGEGLAPGDLAATALPFLLGWALTAPFLGAFSEAARGNDVGAAIAAAAKSWAVATPVSLLLRAVSQGRAPPTAFAVVSFVVTGVLLLAWRATAAVQAPKRDRRAAASRNKAGNPLEFLTLLSGLVKRW